VLALIPASPQLLSKSAFFHRRFGALGATEDLLRVERVVAFARVLVSTVALMAIWMDPTEPVRYASFSYALVSAYAASSIGVLFWLRARTTLPRGEAIVAHGADILFATALTLFTEGPNSPFFVFFVYALLAAAYRWGSFETLFTTVAVAVLMLVEAVLVNGYGGAIGFGFVDGHFDVNLLIMRVFYLWIIGICVGYMGETAHQRRKESAAIASLGRDAWRNTGQGLLQSVLGPALQLYGSRRAVAVLKGRANKSAVWQCDMIAGSNDVNTSFVLDDAQRAIFLEDESATAWHAIARTTKWVDAVILNREGLRIRSRKRTTAIRSLIDFAKCRSVMSVPLEFRDAVIGRVFVFDPHIPLFERDTALRLGQRIAAEVAPAAHNVFRLRRLRSRAESGERARIARELHDGLVQSISAAELRVDVVRRRVSKSAPEEAAELARVQAVLSSEVRSLRLLTRRMQLTFSSSNELLDTLFELLTRFERETGIAVHFHADRDAYVPSHTRYEIVRIVQEGLTNIRKHSGAKHVTVRLVAGSGSVRLVIEDDGQGFAFAGQRSQRELEVMSAGPLVIRERVRLLRGELRIVSTPGKGARLDVTVPAT
jgi:signal transduction histidine kinase